MVNLFHSWKSGGDLRSLPFPDVGISKLEDPNFINVDRLIIQLFYMKGLVDLYMLISILLGSVDVLFLAVHGPIFVTVTYAIFSRKKIDF